MTIIILSSEVEGTYAMACLLTSGEKDVVAIVTVEQKSGKLDGIEYFDRAHSISGRIKKEPADGRLQEPDAQRRLTSAGTITIADFLDIVNICILLTYVRNKDII